MFIETALLDRVTYGFQGGPTYSTTLVELYSGIIARNAERTQPLYRFTAPYENISSDHHDDVIKAYIAAMGPLHGFRFKDWADYQLEAEPLGIAVGDVGEEMQLIKTYDFGPLTTVRTIKKPIAAGFQLFADGVPLASTLDTTTGIVTFTAAAGEAISATGEFDVPVMFAMDSLQFNFANYRTHSIDIDLTEDLSA
jgi:uncharacterized protein (TIGR02217 family)